MRVLVIVALAALASCAERPEESRAEQAICTIEDQQSGTCPETAWIIDLAISYTAEQYPDENPVFTWGRCQRTQGRWSCTVRLDLAGGAYIETTCVSNSLCWSVRSPGSLAPETSICTEGDPNCGDPGGGGGPGPGPDVAGATESHASSIALQYQQSGHTLVAQTASLCGAGHRSCLVNLDFGNFRIEVTCFDFGPPRGVECWSRVL